MSKKYGSYPKNATHNHTLGLTRLIFKILLLVPKLGPSCPGAARISMSGQTLTYS